MTRAIPTPPAGVYDYQGLRVELDGAFYVLRLRFSARGATWLMDLAAADGTRLADGIVLRAGGAPCARFRGRDGFPPGAFYVQDTTGRDADPGIDELGERVRLLYVPAAELAEVIGG